VAGFGIGSAGNFWFCYQGNWLLEVIGRKNKKWDFVWKVIINT
jgi:hypothetical protein